MVARDINQRGIWRTCPSSAALHEEMTVWGRGCKAYHGRHVASATPPIRAPALDGHGKGAPYTWPDDEPFVGAPLVGARKSALPTGGQARGLPLRNMWLAATPPIRAPAFDGRAKAAPRTGPDEEDVAASLPRHAAAYGRRENGGVNPPLRKVQGLSFGVRRLVAAFARRDSSRRTFAPLTSHRLQKAGPSSRTPKTAPPVSAPAFDGHAKAAPHTGPDEEGVAASLPRHMAAYSRLENGGVNPPLRKVQSLSRAACRVCDVTDKRTRLGKPVRARGRMMSRT